MKPISLLLMLVALPAFAEPPHRTLPDGVHATRIQSGTVYRVLQVKEQDPDGKPVVKYITDDAPTQVPDGMYFTNAGYERLLLKTSELQVNIQKLKAATIQPPPVVITPPDIRLGFSARTVAVAGLVGVLLGFGAAAVLTLARGPSKVETPPPASNVIPMPGVALRR